MKTLGLSDNPFYPRKLRGATGETKYLQTLQKEPLRVHKCAALEKLYFKEFPGASELERRRPGDLLALGYEPGEQRPNASFVAIVRGNSGCGKTTLAASFLRYLTTCRGGGEADWVAIDRSFPDTDITHGALSEKDIQAVTNELGSDLSKVGDDNWVCALIDNVTAAALGGVLNEYARATHVMRVFVLASDNIPLLEDDLSNYPVQLEDYKLGPLDPQDAIDYARFRIGNFRHIEHPSHLLADEMFPLLPSAVRGWIEPRAGQTNPLFVRGLNSTLYKKVDALLQRFGQDDIRNLPPPGNVTRETLERILGEL